MPDLWYPGAQRFQGAHANYKAGRIANLTTILAHFTVGRNSIGTCGRDFQILADRDGTIHQGAPVDAVCWGAGDPWNRCSLHVEVEYLPGFDDEVFTPECRQSVSGLLHWANTEHGIPLDYWDGDRIPAWNGTIAHGSVIQTGDRHTDSWPRADWDLMVGTAPTEEDDVKPMLLQPIPPGANDPDQGKVWAYNPLAHTKTWIRTNDALNRAIALFGPPDPDPANAALVADARTIEAGGGASPATTFEIALTGTAFQA